MNPGRRGHDGHGEGFARIQRGGDEVLNIYLAAIGALAVVLAFESQRTRDLPVSAPLLALALGVLLGPEVLGLVTLNDPAPTRVLHEASRLLLAVSLVGVALRYPARQARRHALRVGLLLAVAMPAMALTTALLAALLLGLPPGLALVLGACLAPTDPVLASSIVTGRSAEELVPARLRELISLESGANDGLALPLVALAVFVVEAQSVGTLLVEALWSVVAGVVIGLALGFVAGRAMRASQSRHDVEPSARLLFSLVLGLFVLGAAELAHGDGILAVFVAGLAYNYTATGADRTSQQSIDEGINRFVVLPMFTLLGVALPWEEWVSLGWRGVVLAAAVLVLRRPPVIAALRRRLDLNVPATVFMGWFGPVGASGLFYLTYVHDQGVTDPRIFAAGTLVITASVLAHGVSGAPVTHWYGSNADSEVASAHRA